ncbi:angiotensin-converting enzyme isoform X2 [Cephus cinctus]|uniref:Angiotensin-converting enzyme n=1 Tax=Cephus cinctus TaxID=211228 RepID=A0AAJ7RHZ7_CEPCN|nr:angiotensin-converting enzyme isoform X2 [Cephus cinctus]
MSIWIYTLLYVTAILTASQICQGITREEANAKEGSGFRYVKASLGYAEVLQRFKRGERENLHSEFPGESSLPEPAMFLEMLNNVSIAEYHRNAMDQWNFESNITEHTRKAALKSSKRLAQFQRAVWHAAMQYDWKNFNDSQNWKRQFQLLSVLGSAALDDKKFSQLDEIVNHMESVYSTATIVPYTKHKNKAHIIKKVNNTKKSVKLKISVKKENNNNSQNVQKSSQTRFSSDNKSQKKLRLEPDLVKIMAQSEDPEELGHVWKAWHDATGRKIKNKYVTYVELMKEIATLNNFSSAGKYWTHAYEDPDFEKTVEDLWKEVKPLYLQLHAYVRHRLRKKYGSKVVRREGYIPGHLLGDMWAQSWIHVHRFAMPYPNVTKLDLTKAIMEKIAEDFFHSIGFPMLPSTFWNNSILARPRDNRELVCHGSAWDMYDGQDFRIKMCTQVTYDDLVIVHHEMGHVYYYMQYKDQPIIFREGGNPGFHEAIGDTIALSVSSPVHTARLGLTESSSYSTEEDINFLFLMALQKVAFLPFAYVVDKWRWIIFGDETNPKNYNGLWWKLREEIQGIEPPIDRTKEDFDPGAKYHIAANVPYIRYLVSFIIQFQFLEAVCLASGQYDPGDVHRPLHRCDIYGSLEAGIGLKQMMRLGASKPWPDAMEMLTGYRTMQTKGLLAYFHPLYLWLRDENKRNHEPIGF